MKPKNIVFVHGWASGPYVWINQVSFFKDNYNVHTPQLLGYDTAQPLATCINSADSGLKIFECTAKDIHAFIVEKDLNDVCLVGWSLGGMVSLKLASDLKKRISSLVLIDTTVCFVRTKNFKYGVPINVVEKIFDKMETNFKATLDWFYKFCFSSNEKSRNEYGDILKMLGDVMSPLNEEALKAGLKLLMEMDASYLLADIDMPALIIHGRHDKVCPVEAAEFMARGIKNSRLEIFETSGHAPFLTDHKKVNDLIEGFIAG